MRLLFTYFCLLFSLAAAAQTSIRGRITLAPDGEAAIGATVLIKGTTVGARTDFDGNFAIEAPAGSTVLVASYIGYVSQEIPLNGQTSFDIRLEENSAQLEEIVVTGYGSQKRSSISGSVSTVSADEIAERPILRVEQALQGRTAGVQVAQNSGSPGSSLAVRVRGVGTINNADPLYIVDGIPVDGLDFLNPNDIENINVLKDAASAAIYGSRGANGVVLITTKGGRRNQDGKISYEAYYGIQTAQRYMELLNAREYATLQNEAFVAAGKTPLPEFANPEQLGEGTNWQEAIFEPAPIASHQLSFTGGGEKSAYTLSGNYFSQDGIVGGDKANFQRATARFNATHDLKKWLTIGNNIGFTWLERQGLIENSQYNSPLIRALNMDPMTPVRKADGTYAYSNYSSTDIANPVNGIEQTYNSWRSNRLVGSVFSDIKLAKGLTFRSTFSLDATFAVNRGFIPKFDLSNVPELSEAPAAEKSLINTVSVGNHFWRNWQAENYLTWNKTFAGTHNLTMIAGTTALNNRYDANGGANTNLPSNSWEDAYISNTVDPIGSQSAYQWATESSLLSYFAKANYEWNRTYLFSATFRADGSSRFGRNNRYGYFPSFSAGWVASHEDFWKIDLVNFFKIRASWGQNGNDRIGDYSFTTVVNNGQNYTFGPDETITNGAVALTAANPDLRWETSTQTDIGLDAELWDGRVQFTTDYYIKKTTDMLYAAPIPLVAGTAAPIQNVATAENRGWELSLNYRNRDRVLKYSLGGNIAFVKSEVTSLGRGGEPVLSGFVQSANANAAKTDVGHPVASFFGYVTDGIFQNQEEIEAAAFQSAGTAPGDIRFKDLDGNGVIDENDRTYIGNPTPRFIYGFNADLEWKGFEMNLFFQGTQGNDIFMNLTRYDFSYVNRPASALQRWTGEGTSNVEPRVSLSDPNQNARISDRFIQDGSYLRLKTLQIGYNLPKTWLEKVRCEKLKVYMTAQNLLTFTRYTGLDPEIGNVGGSLEIGIDRGFYPQARTIMGGVSVTF
ncbi:MAG: TonB-dependent receptor [Saprospiraceae bacterium]|nr:TonB-dependent receptor [Saprospiraceae bacterium]